jgi:hypothetical protein
MAKLNTPQGQLMSLSEALALQDVNGDPIEWKEVEGRPGEYTAVVEKKSEKVGDKEHKKTLPGQRYTYGITNQITGVVVTMSKQTIKPEKQAKEEAEAGLTGAVPEEAVSNTEEDEEEGEGKTKRSYSRRS